MHENFFSEAVNEEESGIRIDKWISDQDCGLSRNAAQKLLSDGAVEINGKKASKNTKVSAGDIIEFEIPEPEELKAEPENIPVEIVYEDDDLLVVNKPKGMVVHPAAGNYNGTLVNALLYHCRGRLSSIN